MSYLSSLLLLLLCLSMHACSGGRHLRAIDKDSSKLVHTTVKDDEKKAQSILTSQVKSSLVKVVLTQNKRATKKKSAINGSLGGGAAASIPKPNEIEETKRVVAGVAQVQPLGSVSWRIPHKEQGSEVIISSDVGVQQSTKIEVKRQVRSVLGSEHHVTEEIIDSNDDGMGKDVLVMDYDSPHRKPPIHNLSP